MLTFEASPEDRQDTLFVTHPRREHALIWLDGSSYSWISLSNTFEHSEVRFFFQSELPEFVNILLGPNGYCVGIKATGSASGYAFDYTTVERTIHLKGYLAGLKDG